MGANSPVVFTPPVPYILLKMRHLLEHTLRGVPLDTGIVSLCLTRPTGSELCGGLGAVLSAYRGMPR